MDIKPENLISIREIATVVSKLKNGRRYKNNRMNLAIFRLATCCGLRASEIADLRLSDLDLRSSFPAIRVRNGKGGKRRQVPLWWDGSTLADLTAWHAERKEQGATPEGFLLVTAHGKRVDRSNLRKRFLNVTKILNRDLTIHSGRHSFCSNALAGGRSLVEVRDAAGHSNVSVTNTYLHAVSDDGAVGELFTASRA